jgi:hypothetical protein
MKRAQQFWQANRVNKICRPNAGWVRLLRPGVSNASLASILRSGKKGPVNFVVNFYSSPEKKTSAQVLVSFWQKATLATSRNCLLLIHSRWGLKCSNCSFNRGTW